MPDLRKTNKPGSTARENTREKLERFLWLRKNFIYCLGLTALVWIVGLNWYINNFIGWDSIMAVKPSDFAQLILSATVPLLLLWFLLAYIERSSSLDANAELFRNYIDNLLYPGDAASKQAKTFAKTLQEQVGLLRKENVAVLEQSALVKKDLESRLAELSNVLQLLDDYSENTLKGLNEGVRTLADKCAYVTDKTTNSVNNMRSCSEDITENTAVFLGRITPLIDEISAVSSNIKNNIADNRLNLTEIKSQLEQGLNISRKYTDTLIAQTAENTLKIEQAFYKTADEYDALYKRIDTSISSLEGRIEEQKRLIGTQTQVLAHNSELLDSKLSKYGKILSLEIDKLVKNSVELEKMTKKQISSLKMVNAETGKSIHNIGGAFDEKRVELEQRCEYAVKSIQNVIVAIKKETDKLISFTNLAQSKNYDLEGVAKTIVDKIGDMSSQLALKTDVLKDKAVEVIDKFTEANDLICKSTEKINTSSNLVVSNGKEGVKLLEEQNLYLNNTVSGIDTVKEKLEQLREGFKKISAEAANTTIQYEKKIEQYNETGRGAQTGMPTADFSHEQLIYTAQTINKTFQHIGIKAENIYAGADIFDLWDSYLNGKNNTFTEFLAQKITRKQTAAIRKAFDDNQDFHDIVIKYLFLMDVFIKEMTNAENTGRNELVNLSVKASLDKIYFILIKVLNSVE